LLALPLFADELVLKDGKRVKWVVLKDLGDTFEVETPEGVKVEIKKNEVVKFDSKVTAAAKKEEAAAASAALTGATFTWEKGRKLIQFDLLRSIDVKRDAIRGTWKLSDGTLSVDASSMKTGAMSLLETTYIPPPEYDLTLVIERSAAGDNVFFVGLVGGERQVAWGMDVSGGWQGPWMIDGKNPEENKLGIREALFTKVGEKKTVVFMVRNAGFAVKVDGKVTFTWLGDWTRVRTAPIYGPEKNIKSFYFGGALSSKFKVSHAVVTFPKE
jgi:hypothetical protein